MTSIPGWAGERLFLPDDRSVFYAGDAWGSFNAWMRVASGVLFGLGIVWFVFPYLEMAFSNADQVVRNKVLYRQQLRSEKARLTNLLRAKMAEDNPGRHKG